MRGARPLLALAVTLAAWAASASAQTGPQREPRMPDLVPPPTTGTESSGRLSTDEGTSTEPLTLLKQVPFVGQAGPVDPRTYRLGPGDMLELDLWGRLAKSVLLEVSPEGKIFLSGSGSLAVSGSTLADVRAKVLDLVRMTFRGVQADLRLVRLRHIKVYVSGEVRTAGAFEATPAMRASEVVALAVPGDSASRRDILVRHLDGTTSRLDVARFEVTGRTEYDPFLDDGDLIVVPRRTTLLGAYGAVMRPGAYEWVPGDSLSTLLEIAGGLVPSTSREHMLLVRFDGPAHRDSMWLDGNAVATGAFDLPIQDGDRFFAFFLADWHQVPIVEIYGEVDRPGSYPIVVGRDRLSDLVRWAGGFSPRADRAAVQLVRPIEGNREADPDFDRLVRLSRSEMTESEYAEFQTKLSKQRNSFRVDFTRVTQQGSDVDPLLREQDVVRVDPIVLSVRVEGQVRHPGLIEYRNGRDVSDYVQLAGGYTRRASPSGTRVSRAVTGQVMPAKGLRNVQPGDFIWVPERHDLDAWALFRDVLAVAGQIAVVVVAVRR